MATKRGKNYGKGMAAQAAIAVDTLKNTVRRALCRGVCPECGGALVRDGSSFMCRTPECYGLGRVTLELQLARAEAQGQ